MRILLLLLLLTAPFRSWALEIERPALELSIGFLRCQKYPQTGEQIRTLAVYSTEFEAFRTAQDRNEMNSWLPPNAHKLDVPSDADLFFFEPGRPFDNQPASTIFEDRSTKRLFTMWRDTGFEISKQAIVVWRSTASKLTLETVLDLSLLAGIGRAYISEVHHIDSKQHLIIGRTAGGDGGDTWGSVWVALWTEPRNLRILHSVDYQGDWKEQSRLEYSFNPKKLKLQFTQLTRTFPDDPNGIATPRPPTEWAEKKTWTLDLAPLISRGSSN